MRTWWGWSTETTIADMGYFYCPECQARQRTGVYHVRRRFHVCLVPVHTQERVAAFYRCDGCRREYPAEEGHGFDFSDRPEPSTWTCFKCGTAAPGHVFICPQCGFSLNRTLESLRPEESHG
jgi:hypothetical protein